jgi:hypothetical protein
MPAPDPRLREDVAHDILAAEEFIVPAPDPRLKRVQPRDVLAAEEFGMPAPDPALRISGMALPLPEDPYDPAGSEPAHDILAAEEFAVPGGAPRAVPPDFAGEFERGAVAGRALKLAALLGGGLLLGRRLRRRGPTA